MSSTIELTEKQEQDLLTLLKNRFEKALYNTNNLKWKNIQNKLLNNKKKLWSLYEMERTGGEPNIVDYIERTDEYLFFDCSTESPKGRRSICYDYEAQTNRKKNKPLNNAISMATQMGIEILNREDYFQLQKLGHFDSKSSNWIETPAEIRNLGGALFADFRYKTVFFYHNSADSYYKVRGFRGKLKI